MVEARGMTGPAELRPSPQFLRMTLATIVLGAVAFMAVVRVTTPDQSLRYLAPVMVIAALFAAAVEVVVRVEQPRQESSNRM